MVTIPVTQVNTLVEESFAHLGYLDPGMPEPKNRLEELMRARGLRDPELADKLGISKQHMGRLRKGDRKITREWAERIVAALEELRPISPPVTWPEIMGWRGQRPSGAISRREDALRWIGERVAWGIQYRGFDNLDAAKRFEMTPERLDDILAGAVEMGVLELSSICARLSLPSEFILLGEDKALPFLSGDAYRSAMAAKSSSP